VAGFYFVIVIPGLHTSLDRLVSQHARAIAETRPTEATARALARKLDMEVRFEGPDTTWSTDADVPTMEGLTRLRAHHPFTHSFSPRHTYYVASTPRGNYIFSRTFGARFGHAHNHMLLMLLILMIGVFVTAYLVLQRALRPLRLLTAGVTQVGEGHLDVVVPKQSEDEFGALTDAFNHMARRVRDMVRARDQLLLDVSHELRSPITRVKVALAMLPESPQKLAMTSDVDEMEAMVSELLELERLRGGHGIQAARCDLIALVLEMVERYRDRAPGVRLGQAPSTLWLDLDRDRVRTVLRNLLENAVKFSLPDSRPVEITVVEHEQEIAVRISDDGPGIPAGDAERLFEPFFRLDRSRSKKTGGYGLGLSICKRIMEAHGGTITTEAREERGATFVLTFPRPVSGRNPETAAP
jgi:signal transduction histidine kinase